MTVSIEPVRSRQQRREFVRFARRVYADQPLWVPNLERDSMAEITPGKNPFFEQAEIELFLARRQGQTVGRIAAIDNMRHNEYWKERVGFFGYYESINDLDTSRALFSAAEQWLRGRNLNSMRGPTNPSMNASAGFLSDGFDLPPRIPMSYTLADYLRHAQAYGLQPAIELLVYYWQFDEHSDSELQAIRRRIERVSKRVQQRAPIRLRKIRMDCLDEEINSVRRICNASLSDNWGYVPISAAEIRAARDELRRFADPEMFAFAEMDGQPEAVFFSCPDYNELLKKMDGRLFPLGWWTYLRHRRRIRNHVVYVYAATPKAHAAGAGAVVYDWYFNECVRRGINHLESGYVLESNLKMRNSLEKFGLKVLKRYQVFGKEFDT